MGWIPNGSVTAELIDLLATPTLRLFKPSFSLLYLAQQSTFHPTTTTYTTTTYTSTMARFARNKPLMLLVAAVALLLFCSFADGECLLPAP